MKNLEIKVERIIPASPEEVYDAWLNPNTPGTPWNISDKLLLNPEVDGFFYWRHKGTPHYGRFTETARPSRLQHTWVSPNTLGEETTVTVSFENHEDGTRMTLVHTDLPNAELAEAHENGWAFFCGPFADQFGAKVNG
jgi:uncharacterized protein YndB with AHSA1/START domain